MNGLLKSEVRLLCYKNLKQCRVVNNGKGRKRKDLVYKLFIVNLMSYFWLLIIMFIIWKKEVLYHYFLDHMNKAKV